MRIVEQLHAEAIEHVKQDRLDLAARCLEGAADWAERIARQERITAQDLKRWYLQQQGRA